MGAVIDAEHTVKDLVNIVKGFEGNIWNLTVTVLFAFLGPRLLIRIYHLLF